MVVDPRAGTEGFHAVLLTEPCSPTPTTPRKAGWQEMAGAWGQVARGSASLATTGVKNSVLGSV